MDKQLHQAIDGFVAGKHGHTEAALALTLTTTTGTEPFREAKSPRSPYTFGRIPYAELPQQASRYLFTLGSKYIDRRYNAGFTPDT